MTANDLLSQLETLSAELPSLAPDVNSAAFVAWRGKTFSVLTQALGAQHHLVTEFNSLPWWTMRMRTSVFGQLERDDEFSRSRDRAIGVLEAARYVLTELAAPPDPHAAAQYDTELWEHVGSHVLAEEWGKLASQTAIFTEDRLRKWAGRPDTEVGETLMTAILGDNGEFRLGRTPGEKQGWHRFGMGLSMAQRNVDAHRIQERADHRRYAIGVLGASSLLLTQMRYEHGNRFRDQSPVVESSDADVAAAQAQINQSKPGGS